MFDLVRDIFAGIGVTVVVCSGIVLISAVLFLRAQKRKKLTPANAIQEAERVLKESARV